MKPGHRRGLLLAAAVGAVTLGAGALAPAAVAGADASPSALPGKVALPQGAPHVPTDAARLGSAPPDQVLDLDVALAGQDPTGLAQAVAAVSTPGSPDYRHYLTPAQYAARFGPTATEVAQVSAALRAEGLTVGTPDQGSNLLPVHGTAAAVSAAFGTPLETVQSPHQAPAIVNTASPQVPASLAGSVTAVVGLDGLFHEHAMVRPKSGLPATPSPGATTPNAAGVPGAGSPGPASGPSSHAVDARASTPQACAAAQAKAIGGTYTSTQMSSIFGLDQLFAQGRIGLGQSIAIVEFEQYSQNDFNAFESCYGLSSPIRNVVVDGGPGGSPGGGGEAALDTELASFNAPAASLVVYETPNDNDAQALDMYDRIASDDSSQRGDDELGQLRSPNRRRDAPGGERDLFPDGPTGADGDRGVGRLGLGGLLSRSWSFHRTRRRRPRLPAECRERRRHDNERRAGPPPGGVERLPGSAVHMRGTRSAEGRRRRGGSSAQWQRPVYQNGFTTVRHLSGPFLIFPTRPTRRMGRSPHTSMDYGAGSEVPAWLRRPTPGSSRTPTRAASPPSARPGSALYGAGNSPSFNDITIGNNDLTGTNSGQFPAVSGYDAASGLGTPVDQNLAIALQGASGCPSVASVSPNTGPHAGGGAVTISGGGFLNATAVTFGSAGTGQIVNQSENSITVIPPNAPGPLCVDVTVQNSQGISATSAADHYGFDGDLNCGQGYRFVASDGGIFDYGDATFWGSTGSLHLNAPVVGMADTPSTNGYWMVAADGGIFDYGDAPFFGSMGGQHLNRPIVGMASTANGKGYWMVAADGGIFNFGNAPFFGSTGSMRLNKPIVGMAATPDGGGYWLVASDGGIFSYGDAKFWGSAGSLVLNSPVVGMAAGPGGNGYWLVAADGGIFDYGSAGFFGSAGSIRLNQPVVGMAATSDGNGYWLVAADGGIFTYGDAPFFGSTGSIRLNKPIVGMSSA